jgi:hypothetical protein
VVKGAFAIILLSISSKAPRSSLLEGWQLERAAKGLLYEISHDFIWRMPPPGIGWEMQLVRSADLGIGPFQTACAMHEEKLDK